MQVKQHFLLFLLFFIVIMSHITGVSRLLLLFKLMWEFMTAVRPGCYDLGNPWNWAFQIFVWTLTVYLIWNSEDSSYLDTPARTDTTALQKQMVVLTGTSSSLLLGHSSETPSRFTPQSFHYYTNVMLHKMHLFDWLLFPNAITFQWYCS